MTDKRTLPVQPQLPGDDDTIVYKITGGGSLTDASYLIVGDTVFLSDEGIQVVASVDGNYDDQNAYTFRDADGRDIGGLYARDDAGQNIVAIRAVDPPAAGDDVLVELEARADPTTISTAAAQVNVQATRVGEATDTVISLSKDDNSSDINIITHATDGRVRIKPRLNLVGASNEVCDVYIKDSYFILRYNDGGTTRYKYLDLSGTGVTWVHSTSEP